MLKIGLTGGIGSGKSTVAKYFTKLKIPVIDADKIVHELLRSDTVVYKKIVAHFGVNLLTPRKLISRRKLRDLIFFNNKERIWLEKLLHPKVRTIMQKSAAKFRAPYCIMVIPLFFETKFPIRVDRVLVIDCPKKLQIERMYKRGFNSKRQIRTIIKTQVSRNLRLQSADDVIRNTGSLKHLEKAVKKLHLYYLSIA